MRFHFWSPTPGVCFTLFLPSPLWTQRSLSRFSCSILQLASWFQFSEVFSQFVDHFFQLARERGVKLRHFVYEVWLVSYLFFSFQIWHLRKWMLTSIRQSKHMVLMKRRQSAIGQFSNLSLITVPEVFAKVNSVQFSSRFWSWELNLHAQNLKVLSWGQINVIQYRFYGSFHF